MKTRNIIFNSKAYLYLLFTTICSKSKTSFCRYQILISYILDFIDIFKSNFCLGQKYIIYNIICAFTLYFSTYVCPSDLVLFAFMDAVLLCLSNVALKFCKSLLQPLIRERELIEDKQNKILVTKLLSTQFNP